jgi:hypothetical protein
MHHKTIKSTSTWCFMCSNRQHFIWHMLDQRDYMIALLSRTAIGILTGWPTDFMEQSPWKASSHSASQEIPRLLWNSNVHYRVQNTPPHVSILSQISPVHIFPSCFRVIQSNIILLPSDFPNQILYAFLVSHVCYMPRPSHPPSHDYRNYIWCS